jgi:hypothetical protein
MTILLVAAPIVMAIGLMLILYFTRDREEPEGEGADVSEER